MDSPVLVERDIESGRQLLAALDGHKVPVVAAFWQQQSETQVWRLVVATRWVNEKGPLAVYQVVNDVLRLTIPPIQVRPEDVQVVGVFDGLVVQLMTFRGTDGAPFIGGTWIQHEAVGDAYVESVYLYRAEHFLKDGRIDVIFAVRDHSLRKWKEVSGHIEATTDSSLRSRRPEMS